MFDDENYAFRVAERLAVNGGPSVVRRPEGSGVLLRELPWGDCVVLSPAPQIGHDCWPGL